jgi:chromosome segregation ATPase
MTASKRKNETVDDVASQLTKMVIVGDRDEKENNGDQEPPAALMTTMERMKKLSEQWEQEEPIGFVANNTRSQTKKPFDAIAQSIGSVMDDYKTDVEIEKSLLEQAEEIKSHLSMEINQAKELRKKETGVIGDLSAQFSKFHEQRHNLLREIDELDDRQRLSQEKIALYQEEASQELDGIIDVEEEQKQHVPRLKMTISLYASTTGIKWDFADPDLLSGQVVRQKLHAHSLLFVIATIADFEV